LIRTRKIAISLPVELYKITIKQFMCSLGSEKLRAVDTAIRFALGLSD
jgi:hypothetical protein